MYFPDGLTPKKFWFLVYQRKIKLDKHQQQHLFACCFQLTKNIRHGLKIQKVLGIIEFLEKN